MSAMILRLTASYLLWLLIFTIALFVVALVLLASFSATLPSSISLLLPSICALMPGDLYAKRYYQLPSKGLSWGLATLFVVISNLLGVAIVGLTDPDLFSQVGFNTAVFAVLVAILLVQILATRMFFNMGAKQCLKRERRLAIR